MAALAVQMALRKRPDAFPIKKDAPAPIGWRMAKRAMAPDFGAPLKKNANLAGILTRFKEKGLVIKLCLEL